MILQGEQIGKERMRGGAVLLEMGLNGSFALFREKSFSLVRKYGFRKKYYFSQIWALHYILQWIKRGLLSLKPKF